ncbi:MAG: ABC transporter substrate-binding protein [Rhodospirillales bacterium]|nr:ABC transporter substrate-binding protein [Rhodospirillales bacterium]
MRISRRIIAGCLAPVFLLVSAAMLQSPADAKEIRLGLGDIESVETLNLLVAIERTKARGVDVQLISFKSEDVANQAIVNDQADIGIGTPYAIIQKVKAPIRLFFQLSTLQFYPVVNTEHYNSWKDLDGGDLVVHSRTSGTLAIANLMAQTHGIKYGTVSYVPGSEVRALGMLNGNIKASIIDSVNTNFLMDKAPGKFKVLPLGELNASDEALFARTDYLEKNADTVGVFLEELLKTWREINKNPAAIADMRKQYGLLKDLPKDLEKEILPYYELGAKGGMFPTDGGGAAAAKADFQFYSVAGQIQGDPMSLKLEDFWYLEPLNAALKKVGM